jgi:small subunit ribosomal protein S8
MTVSDPIADMLTRIRNALMEGHTQVAMPTSKIKVAIAQILKEEGYIQDFSVVQEKDRPHSWLRISLKYVGSLRERRSVISGLKRVSKPGRRVYVGRHEIPWVLSGMGIAILSTSQGVMADQTARRKGVGGELLCYVW